MRTIVCIEAFLLVCTIELFSECLLWIIDLEIDSLVLELRILVSYHWMENANTYSLNEHVKCACEEGTQYGADPIDPVVAGECVADDRRTE